MSNPEQSDYFLEAILGDFVVNSGNIMSLIISMDLEIKLPVMRFVFTGGAVVQRNAPIQDGSIINIRYGISETIARKIEFVVRSCSFFQAKTSFTYSIVAVLSVGDHKAESLVYEAKTSDKVAEAIAEKHGFKFVGDSQGDDEMTWLQLCQDDWSFLKDVEECAYVREYDSAVIFPDIWKNLTYTTLKKQLDGDEKAVLVTEGMVHNLSEEQKSKYIVVSSYKCLCKSGMINSMGGYGSRVSMHDDETEYNVELRDESSIAKNVNRKLDFTKDLSANINYGYQPTSVHAYYNYAKAVNEYVRLSLFTDLLELQATVTGLKEEQIQTLLDLKPSDCVYFLAMLQGEEPDPIIRGKYVIKRADVNYSSEKGLMLHFLIGRNGINLTGTYQGTPTTSSEKGEAQATGVQPLGSNQTEDMKDSAGPLGLIGGKEPPGQPQGDGVALGGGMAATEKELAEQEKAKSGSA
jgi:hypothetical protein